MNREINAFFVIVFVLASLIGVVEAAKFLFKKKFAKYFGLSNKKKFEGQYDELIYEEKYKENEYKIILPVTFAYLVVLMFILINYGDALGLNYAQYFEITLSDAPSRLLKTIAVIGINMILYSGFFAEIYFETDFIQRKNLIQIVAQIFYAPLLEEMVYRGVLFNSMRLIGYSNKKSALVTSFLFGISHLRHIFDNNYKRRLLSRIIFQSVYTSLFGLYTCFAYSFAGTLLAPIALHSLCNYLQMPNFSYLRCQLSGEKKKLISSIYITGILTWIFFLVKFY